MPHILNVFSPRESLRIIPHGFFLRLYLFLERGKGREKERERSIDVQEIHQLVASPTCPTRDLAHNPGMCPELELNQRPFGLQAGTQSTEPH